VLGCERGGTYKPTGKKPKKDGLGSRKCGCPFRIRGYFHVTSRLWNVSVTNGTHNHELDSALQGHLIAGRLKPDEKELLEELTRNFVAPKNIMSAMKERDPNNVTDARQIYNARWRLKQRSRSTMNEMQHLMKLLDDNNYFFKARTNGESEYVHDIFFAHPKSVCLFNTFPTVLLMDSTYKTNKYGMPLFENVGETSFEIVVTDRDTALMNVVATVFPESAHLVCYFHV
jgi:hypothetical protein